MDCRDCKQGSTFDMLIASNERLMSKMERIGDDTSNIRIDVAELRIKVRLVPLLDDRVRALETESAVFKNMATKKQFWLSTLLAAIAIVATLLKDFLIR